MTDIKIWLVAAAWGMAFAAQGELLVDLPTNATYVASSQNGQGVSGGAVPWSLTSPRSPASGYSGIPYYGGMTGSLAVTVAGMSVANATPDYINCATASGAIGDWVVMAPMFQLTQASSLTNVTLTPRLTGSAAQQTNHTRIIIQQDGNLYASSTNWYFNSNPQTLNNAALAALSWYVYDPTNNLRGNLAPSAAGVSPTNVTAVGVLFYNENLAARAATIGMSAFQAWGEAVAPPVSITNRLMYWDATNNVSGAQNGSGTWSLTHDNWLNAGAGSDLSWSNETRDRAVFSVAGSGTWTVTVAAATTITNIGISFLSDGAAYEVAGSGTLFMEGAPVITANASAVISAPMTGEAFTKTGNRTLVLAGANSFTGTLVVSSGILQVGNGGNAGDLGHAVVENVQTLIIARANAYNFTNRIDGTGSLVFTNTGTNIWNGISISQDVVHVAGSSTFRQTGGTIQALSRVEVSGSDAGSLAALLVQGGTMTAPTGAVGRSATGLLTVESGGTLQLTGAINPLILSLQSGGTGLVTVTGGGSWLNAPQGTVAVGNGFPALLTIADGGLLTASNLAVIGLMQLDGGTGLLSGQLTLGNNAGHTSILNIDGTGTDLQLTNVAANVAGLFVGNNGLAAMNVTNGTIESGTLYVPLGSGTGSLRVAGGRVVARSSFIVGNVGPGEFDLSDGIMETMGSVVLGQSGTSTSRISGGSWHQHVGFSLNASSTFQQTGGVVSNSSTTARSYGGNTEISGGKHILDGGGNVSVLGTFTLANNAQFINTSTGTPAYLLVGGVQTGASSGQITLQGGSFVMTNALGFSDDLLIAPYSYNEGTVEIAGATAQVRVVSLGGIPTINIPYHRATSTMARLEISAGALFVERGITNLTDSGTSEISLSGGTLGALGNWNSLLAIELADSPGTGVSTFDSAGYTISLDGILTGSGHLRKTGGGQLLLSGINTYSGDTTISSGILGLRATGSLSNSPLLTVHAGATLSVTGRVDGTLTVGSGMTLAGSGAIIGHVLLNGGTLSPGTSPGTLAMSSLAMNSGTYRMEITNAIGTAGVNWDLLSIDGGSGTLDLTGASAGSISIHLESDYTSLPQFPPSGNASWKVVDAGTITGFASNKFTIVTTDFYPSEKYDVTFTISENAGDLFVNTVVLNKQIDLGISIVSSTNHLGLGATNNITVVVTNNSSEVSGSYRVTNTLSPNVTYLVTTSTTNPLDSSVTHFTADGGVFSGGTYANGTYAGGTVTWTLGNLAAGGSTSLSFIAQQHGVPGSTQDVNNVIATTVTSLLTDPNTANNNSSTSFTSVGIPMFSIVGFLILGAVILYIFVRRQRQACGAKY